MNSTRTVTKSLMATLLMVLALLATACHDNATRALMTKSSSGKTLELLVVADRDVYTGSTRQLTDSLLLQPQEGLNQPEPRFDVVNIPRSSFDNTDMFRSHRNVLILEVDSANRNKIYRYTDKYAAPQTVFLFAAHDRPALDSMLRRQAATITEAIYQNEYRRLKQVYTKDGNPSIVNLLHKQFGFGMAVPSEYVIAPPTTPDFMWIRKETKDFSQSILVHTEPYTSTEQFAEDKFLRRLDTLMKQHVPGPADGSYMGMEHNVPLQYTPLQVAGQYAVELRGLWRCYGDYMGGPFVAYSILTPDKRNIVTLTAFLHSPRKPKRDLLMQIDGICRSITFDTVAPKPTAQ